MTKENQTIDPEYEAFANSGEVEVGDSNLASKEDEKPAKKPAAADVDDGDEGDDAGDDDQGDDVGDEGDDAGDDAENRDENPKPKKSAKDFQIERLKREKAALADQLRERQNSSLEEKVDRLEKLLQGGNTGDNQDTGTSAPDPEDFEKYPLGHLDPAYIEDRIEYVADKKAAERADAVLQRQQQTQKLQPLLEKVDDLTVRGTEIYDDFKESVVDAGMRGDWDLERHTFEAAAEAENGVQILYELAQDPKEASRVAKLSPYQQIKYVADKDAEISKSKTPRRIPKAGDPPKNTARGANSRTSINPATDNLDDFEKAWEADARKSNR
jgi:hypothetical protein